MGCTTFACIDVAYIDGLVQEQDKFIANALQLYPFLTFLNWICSAPSLNNMNKKVSIHIWGEYTGYR